MTTGRRANASFLLAELIVVLMGVLIALGVDSWWQGRAERGRELAYLRSINADLAVTVESLQSAIEGDSANFNRLDSALVFLVGQEDVPVQELSRLTATTIVPFKLNTGTLNALVGTGDIGLVQSETLRSQLIASAARFSEGYDGTQSVLSRAANNVHGLVIELTRLQLESESPEMLLASMRRSPVFIGSVSLHQNHIRNQLIYLRDMREAGNELIDAIQQELDQR